MNLDKENMLQVGVITDTHGIRGEVKVFPTTDDIKRFENLNKLYIDSKSGLVQMKINSIRYFKQFVLLTFKGINNINDIEIYKKCPLLIEREDAIELGENEYFITDLIGMTALTEDGHLVGTVKDILQTGANDVYVIEQTDTMKELLLPAIKQCIIKIDTEKNEMIVKVMDGLE